MSTMASAGSHLRISHRMRADFFGELREEQCQDDLDCDRNTGRVCARKPNDAAGHCQCPPEKPTKDAQGQCQPAVPSALTVIASEERMLKARPSELCRAAGLPAERGLREAAAGVRRSTVPLRCAERRARRRQLHTSTGYPVHHIQDFGQRIYGCHVFSVQGLVKAYTQIPVNPDDVPKTAIITPFGLFEFPFMSFGLRNAG
ncbi:hypothetical protein V5799_016059 [Amblyomma americanum]|uniref:Uncharacterized protein n=1 Tax=Amblyomma americanum TaxID=6943 RepID=A0AAQ4F645_AMBAM